MESGRPIATLVGSCVAVCLWDSALALGGMNHFMLPHASLARRASRIDALLWGDSAMEALLNGLLAQGARRSRLQAKAFGGGAVVAALSEAGIGKQNVNFTCRWLSREQIPLIAADFFGHRSRKIVFDPATGTAFCRHGEAIDAALVKREERYRQSLAVVRADIELF